MIRIDKDNALAKLDIINNCLISIELYTSYKSESLDNRIVMDAVDINIQRIIQAVIDLAQNLVNENKLGLPASYKAYFEQLELNNIIDKDLSEALKNMCGFRNILVHNYKQVNKEVVVKLLDNRFNDILTFSKVVVGFIK